MSAIGSPPLGVGGLVLHSHVDGIMTATDGFLAPDDELVRHPEILDTDGKLRLPVGCFLVETAGRRVLIDAGAGPIRSDNLEAGWLPEALRRLGFTTDDIDVIVLSHLHFDHCGWIADRDGRPVFANATVHVGAGDWSLFVEQGENFMRRTIRDGLRALGEQGRVELVDGDGEVVPGVSVIAIPGHTPGTQCIVVSSQGERALLLGDAITCPVQLTEGEWGAVSDVDPAMARRSRELLWRELSQDGTVGAGAHFPGLQFGRVLVGEGRRWWAP